MGVEQVDRSNPSPLQRQEQHRQQQQQQAEVPSYFKCPISLCLMSDPVSICTGITYERASIKKWLDDGRRTCPVTMQILSSHDLIPNRTLQRIIRSWCSTNQSSAGGAGEQKQQQQPPRIRPLDLPDAKMLVRGVLENASSAAESLKRLSENLTPNIRVLGEAGLGAALVSILERDPSPGADDGEEDPQALALNLLPRLLPALDEASARRISLPALSRLLQRGGDLRTRVAAAAVLEQICCADRDSRSRSGSTPGVLEGIVRLVREEQQRPAAIRSALRAALAVCPPMKNRVRLVDSGAVSPLVELLVGSDKATAEAVLAVLECLCGCAEGRAEVSRHALAVPAVAGKMFKASEMASEYAIDVLWAICKYSPEEGVRRRMVEVGIFPKLFFFLQIGCNPRTKNKAGDLLKLLHSAYRECLSNNTLMD